MKAIIYNSKANGIYHATPSKSILHRYIILSCLAKGKSIIRNYQESVDILSTIHAFVPFGVKYKIEDGVLYIDSSNISYVDEVTIDACESATTLRLLIPILVYFSKKVTFIGKNKLLSRPLDEYKNLFGDDIIIAKDKVVVNNIINNDTLYVDASISSHFVSGMIMASLLKNRPTTIIIQSKISSSSYIDLTIDIANKFGANIKKDENVIYIIPSVLMPKEVIVEGDYTQAANFIVLSKINNEIKIEGLNKESLQGDKRINDLLDQDNIDLNNNIDLGPILFAYKGCLNKRTKFSGTNRLIYKESNRLYAMQEELAKFGIKLSIYDDICFVDGVSELNTDLILDSHNDHRVCMGLAIIASISKNKVIINNIECVNKSYPKFFDDLKALGIKIEIM